MVLEQQGGVVQRSLKLLLGGHNEQTRVTVQMSYFEIYNENIYDLLGAEGQLKPLQIQQNQSKRFVIQRLTRWVICDEQRF